MSERLPTLLCLGQQLPDTEDPLVGICRITGLASTPERLLRALQRLGANANCRALLIVDAINEGDRTAWKRALPGIRQLLAGYPNVATASGLHERADWRGAWHDYRHIHRRFKFGLGGLG